VLLTTFFARSGGRDAAPEGGVERDAAHRAVPRRAALANLKDERQESQSSG
jgi:hypothetical protein